MRRRISWLLIAIVSIVAVEAVFMVPACTGFPHSSPKGNPLPHVTTKVFDYVDDYYVEPDRVKPMEMLHGAFKALENYYPSVLIDVDEGKNLAVVRVADATKTIDIAPGATLRGVPIVLNATLAFVTEHLDEDMDPDDAYYAALNGAVGELDPHSNVFNPKMYKDFKIDTSGKFGGIGFVFSIRDGQMTIISPIEGTPASRGGLRSGDYILFIDGEPTINMPVDVGASKMRGEPGTQVTLTIGREGWPEPRELTFTRAIIHVKSVKSYVLDGDGAPPVSYVKVEKFSEDTSDELEKAIRAAEAAHPDLAGIVLDLRNNPGGLLRQAIELSDGFMDRGTIVSTRGRLARRNNRKEASDDKPFSDKPLIVLINQGSASASEIVSGALRGYRALLIGQKTFGKGSVQNVGELPDNAAIKLTVAQYLTANDVSIQAIGIQPDIFVYGARVEQGKVRIGPPPVHTEEADLDKAFTDWGNASEEPWRAVQYYDPPDPEDEDEDKPGHEVPRRKSFEELSAEEKIERLNEDFLISLARRVLGNVNGGADREALIRAAGPVLDKVQVEESDKLAAALQSIGVDWQAGDEPAPDVVSLSVTVPEKVQAKAGAKVPVEISVENRGKSTLHRLWGRTDSDHPVFRNIDFVFGRLEPGEKRTWVAEVKMPKSLPERWAPMSVDLFAGDLMETPLAEGEGGVLSRKGARPQYAYRYVLTDSNAENPAFDGNNVIDPGDTLDLLLDVVNRGNGVSNKTDVNIRTEGKEELFLEAARHKLEDFEPGQRREAPMRFRFEEPDEEGKATVVVSITDTEFGVGFGDELSFDVGSPYRANEDRTPPALTLDAPPLRTTSDSLTLSIQVAHEEELKEFYAYLEGKKVNYTRFKPGSDEATVSFDIELAEGPNLLVLTATDARDIPKQVSFHIYRAESGSELAGTALEASKAANQ